MQINSQSFGSTQAHSDSIEQRDNGSVTHGQDGHVRPEDVKKYLEGATFPATKDELIEQAVQQHAPSHLIGMLQRLYGSEFDSPEARLTPTYDTMDQLIQHIEKVQ
jgi:hypothetical protein